MTTALSNGNRFELKTAKAQDDRLAISVHTQLERIGDVFHQILPSSIDTASFLAGAVHEVTRLEGKGTVQSITEAVLNCASLGLTFGPTLGHAYLVPFKGKATLIVGYQGFIELGLRAGGIRSCYADVVLPGEHWEHYIDEHGPHLRHMPHDDRPVEKFQDILRAYAVYKFSSGESGMRVVPKSGLQKSFRDTPAWNSEPGEQCRKTAIRRAAKNWPKSQQLGHAIAIDEQLERGERQQLMAGVSVPDVIDTTPAERPIDQVPDDAEVIGPGDRTDGYFDEPTSEDLAVMRGDQ